MIGFIGAGTMGGAILAGLQASGRYCAKDLILTAASPDRAEKLALELGVTSAPHARALARQVQAGILVLAIKPHMIPSILDDIREDIDEACTLVSIAAGTPLSALAAHLRPGQPIVRAMPNVGARIRKSMTGMCAAKGVSSKQLAAVTEIFEAVGETTLIAEKDFPAFSALAGCSPAYTFEYIDALARAGVKNGLPKPQAVKIAAQAVLGSAQMLLSGLDSGDTPASLADSVQSPGGTTVAGVVALEEAGFGAAIVKGAQASIDRDKELQG